MICRYCGHRIVWNESFGWVKADDKHRFGIPRTELCDKRPESDGGPSAGHRLPKDPRDSDAD